MSPVRKSTSPEGVFRINGSPSNTEVSMLSNGSASVRAAVTLLVARLELAYLR